jgi:hypothetical protein
MMSLATALQATAAFNLVCTGTLRSGPIGIALPEAQGEPFAVTYRIDADRGLWCSDACARTEEVALIAEGQILLRERHSPSGSHVITIIPAAARFTDTLIEGDQAILRSGRCEPEDFSGFPADDA